MWGSVPIRYLFLLIPHSRIQCGSYELVASFTKRIKSCKDRRLSDYPEDHHRM